MSKRRTHSPEFKARVAMEAISGRKTIQEIAADHAIHPIQVGPTEKDRSIAAQLVSAVESR
jgi:transposase-like protein